MVSPLADIDLGQQASGAGTTLVKPVRARQQPSGFAAVYDRYAKLLGQSLYQQRQRLLEAAGPPWRSRALSEQQALSRLLEHDQPTPEMIERLQVLSESQLAAAALDAIKLVTRAAERGDSEAEAYIQRKRGLAAGGLAAAQPIVADMGLLPLASEPAVSVPPSAPAPVAPEALSPELGAI